MPPERRYDSAVVEFHPKQDNPERQDKLREY